ncbi:MAG: hypothetical protein J6A19_10735 [Oscillospiraceae bacterium]|nr:hypothetical protein [Oscillospiraceae bacterium]
MIISLLFFILSFAVIIRVFAGADSLEREERRRERAAVCAQSLAEAYSVSGDAVKSLELALGVFPEERGERLEISLDEDLNPADGGEITLVLEESRNNSGAGDYSELEICFTRNGGEIYSLKCGAYIPRTGGAEVEQ